MTVTENNVVRVNLKRETDESYDLVIGNNLSARIAKELLQENLGRHVIITDTNVMPLHGRMLKTALKEQGIDAPIIAFPAGEQNKNAQRYLSITDALFDRQYGRDSVILALGGGVVGDLAGFVAATFNRGVPYVQIPTTLIAQSDSSIGGKVAIDTEHGKNLLGAFKQPRKVYIDIGYLLTLDDTQYACGLAETVKHGVIHDAQFFDYLAANKDKILKRDHSCMEHIALKNCEIKGTVVERDPHEKGLRRTLNYGHTVAHALEKISDYTLSHGHAVSIGMTVEGRVAASQGLFPAAALERQTALLTHFRLPTTVPAGYSNDAILAAAKTDKKNAGGRTRYALPKDIGLMHDFSDSLRKEYAIAVSDELVAKALDASR